MHDKKFLSVYIQVRTLRFDVRKNSERKRKKQRDSELVSMNVSIPICAYLSARVEDVLFLQKRLDASNRLLPG